MQENSSREMRCRLTKSAFIPRLDDGVKTAKAAARPPHSKKGGGPSPKKLRAGLEGHVDGLAVFRGERDFLVLLSEFFVHEDDGVIAWRQAFEFEFAVGTADRVERVFDHVDEHAHPGMLVAL